MLVDVGVPVDAQGESIQDTGSIAWTKYIPKPPDEPHVSMKHSMENMMPPIPNFDMNMRKCAKGVLLTNNETLK